LKPIKANLKMQSMQLKTVLRMNIVSCTDTLNWL